MSTSPESFPDANQRGRIFALLGAYFLLQALLRTLVSSSAELDESEQLLFTQSWSWGYGSEPPLYSWLQILAFQVFGTSILGLALLKNLLLLSTFLFTYLAAMEIGRDERTALLAMLSLFLFPQITWESQRDLTHTVLATALAAATFYAAVRTWKSGRALDYVLLGFCVGLATLSKYSYSLLALALVTAAASLPVFRCALLRGWMLLSLAIWVLLNFGHFRWLVLSPDAVLRRSGEVIRQNAGGFVHTRLLGLLSLLTCAIMLGGVVTGVYLLSFRKAAVGPRADDEQAVQQWIWRTLLVIGLTSLVVGLGLGIELRNRWFQPIVPLGAICAALLVRNRLTQASEKRFCRLIGLIGLIVLILLPGIPLAAAITGRPTRLNGPYSALSAQLKSAVPNPKVIVAATRLVGGNLRLSFPRSAVCCPEYAALRLPAGGPWLVVWDASKSVQPPPALANLVTRLRQASAVWKPEYVEAPFQYSDAKKMKLGYVVLP